MPVLTVRRPLVALVVMICAGLAAVTARAALPATSAHAGPAATSARASVRTAATVYEAFSYHGVVLPRQLHVESGYCTSSSAVTRRLDAWRCLAGTQTYDPCFSSVFANPVICPTPWNEDAVEIQLTKRLPRATNHKVPSRTLTPWAIETTSGADCVRAVGASEAIGARKLSYTCNTHTDLWGPLDRHSEPWTIASAPAHAKVTHRLAVAHAWM